MRSFLLRISSLFVLTALALFATHAHAASNFLMPIGPNAVAIPPAYQSPIVGGYVPNTYAFPNASGTGLTTMSGAPPAYSAPQFPDINIVPPAGATGIAPYGQGVSGLGPNGNVTWNYPPATIDVTPPPGAVLPGTPAAISPPVAPVADLGQGPGSNATALGDALNGIRQGAALGSVLAPNPALRALCKAATLGIAGYQLYQYLQANNLDFDANGNLISGNTSCSGPYGVQYFNATPPAGPNPYPPYYTCSAGSLATPPTGTPTSCGKSVNSGTAFLYCVQYTSSPITYPPASAPQYDAAIQAAPPAVLGDAANVYNKMGYPLPVDIPLVPFVSPVSAQSPTVDGGTSTDSVGNTTQQQQKNTVQFSPGQSLSSPPTVVETKTTTTTTNGTPTNVTSTPTAPLSIPLSIPSVSGGGSNTSDLCLQHPEILACANITILNDVASAVLPASTVTLAAVQPVVVGPQAGVCPPPLMLSFMGKSMSLDLSSSLCSFATTIKPFNIAAAGLAGMFLLLGAFRKNG